MARAQLGVGFGAKAPGSHDQRSRSIVSQVDAPIECHGAPWPHANRHRPQLESLFWQSDQLMDGRIAMWLPDASSAPCSGARSMSPPLVALRWPLPHVAS